MHTGHRNDLGKFIKYFATPPVKQQSCKRMANVTFVLMLPSLHVRVKCIKSLVHELVSRQSFFFFLFFEF